MRLRVRHRLRSYPVALLAAWLAHACTTDTGNLTVLGSLRFSFGNVFLGATSTCRKATVGTDDNTLLCTGQWNDARFSQVSGQVSCGSGLCNDLFAESYFTSGDDSTGEVRSLVTLGEAACYLTDNGTRCAGKIMTSVTNWPLLGNLTGGLGISPPHLVHTTVNGIDFRVAAFQKIVAGREHACGLEADGSLWCWGSNQVGQLGPDVGSLAAPKTLSAAIRVPGRFVDAFAGHDNTCGVFTNGNAKHVSCWGSNARWQLGNACRARSCTDPTVPMRRQQGIGNWVAMDQVQSVAIGQDFIIVHDAAGGGVLWGTGDNTRHQLTQDRRPGSRSCPLLGTTSNAPLAFNVAICRALPILEDAVPVVGSPAVLAGVSSVAAGARHACALRDEGAGTHLRCWGEGGRGQLAEDIGQSFRPSADTALSVLGASGLWAGGDRSCLSVGGQTLCTGAGKTGQFGDGLMSDRYFLQPIAVPPTDQILADFF